MRKLYEEKMEIDSMIKKLKKIAKGGQLKIFTTQLNTLSVALTGAEYHMYNTGDQKLVKHHMKSARWLLYFLEELKKIIIENGPLTEEDRTTIKRFDMEVNHAKKEYGKEYRALFSYPE